MALSQLFICMHPIAVGLAGGILGGLIVHSLFITRTGRNNYRSALLIYGPLLLLTLALGSYRFSPFGFSSGRIPLLRGFLVTRSHGVRLVIGSGGTVSIGSGSIAEIQPDLLPGPVDCFWASSTGGALDDPASCDIAYTPSRGALYDVLKVRVRSECSLPTSIGKIKVSILP